MATDDRDNYWTHNSMVIYLTETKQIRYQIQLSEPFYSIYYILLFIRAIIIK